MCALPGGGKLQSAAIVGLDGGVWAQSVDFPAISKAETEALLRGLADPDTLAMTGIVIGETKARSRVARPFPLRSFRRARLHCSPCELGDRGWPRAGRAVPLAGAVARATRRGQRTRVVRAPPQRSPAPPPQYISIGGEPGVVVRGKKGTGAGGRGGARHTRCRFRASDRPTVPGCAPQAGAPSRRPSPPSWWASTRRASPPATAPWWLRTWVRRREAWAGSAGCGVASGSLTRAAPHARAGDYLSGQSI